MRRVARGPLVRGLLDLAFPPCCAGCGAWLGHPLCASCRRRLPPAPRPEPAIPALDACVAAVAYADGVAEWIQRFKYPGPGLAALDPRAAAVVRALAAEAARAAAPPLPDAVVPVPLHPRRLRARGFNPAAVLARSLAADLGLRFVPARLERLRDTRSQTGLDRQGRRRNVAGAFGCRGPVPRSLWLVDDVVTTGATLGACARALRRHGARRVVGVCVARTPRAEG